MLHIQQFLNTCLCDKESKRHFLNIHENTTWISNKRAQRALERSPETKDFKFPFFIALSTTGDTWQSKS